MSAESAFALVIAIALAGYLVWALIHPERF